MALQLEAWTKDARRSRGEQAPQPKLKVRGAVDVDAESFSERLDHLEAYFNKRFDKLLKLHVASMARPEAVVVKAPSAGVAEPSIAARSSEEARLSQSSEHVAQPGSEAKASWPRSLDGAAARRRPARRHGGSITGAYEKASPQPVHRRRAALDRSPINSCEPEANRSRA